MDAGRVRVRVDDLARVRIDAQVLIRVRDDANAVDDGIEVTPNALPRSAGPKGAPTAVAAPLPVWKDEDERERREQREPETA